LLNKIITYIKHNIQKHKDKYKQRVFFNDLARELSSLLTEDAEMDTFHQPEFLIKIINPNKEITEKSIATNSDQEYSEYTPELSPRLEIRVRFYDNIGSIFFIDRSLALMRTYSINTEKQFNNAKKEISGYVRAF
jgi:hypothetical protein